MDINTEVSLEQVYTGIADAIRVQFANVYVEAEREDRRPPQLPACLFEMAEMEAENDSGTGQQPMRVRFEALLIMSFDQPGKSAKMEVRKFAAAFAAFLHLRRWNFPCGPARVIGAYPDDFEPELDQYESWRVEWEQCIDLGASVWTNEGTPPSAVFVGDPAMSPVYASNGDYVELTS